MGCIDKIYSVSALVGSNKCNAACKFCAARELRVDAPVVADEFQKMPITYDAALKLSARYGGWSLSLTSSGEPTCSPNAVTEALERYQECAKQGAYFPNVNLFTNGLRLGNHDFNEKWLPKWKSLGLTAIAVSIHDVDNIGQALAYNVPDYPSLSFIFREIRSYGLQARATLLLRNGAIDNPYMYKHALDSLREYGCENVTSWCVGNPDASYNEFSPSFINRFKIQVWLKMNTKKCHGHIWGGGVYDYNGMLVRYTDYVTKHDPSKDYVRQLVVFQDGLVAYSWIKEGAICLKP